MGAAIAAAVTAPPIAMIAVFLVMGLGLAAPYALIGFVPGLARLLPKPGSWMVILRQALAFPMYGASAWLVWVISQQAGSDGVLATVTGIVLLGLRFVDHRRDADARGAPAFLRPGARGARGARRALHSLRCDDRAETPAPTPRSRGENPYSAARLAALRAEGRPVFVNMTAAWCVTCLVNERIALSSDAVKRAFAERNVAYLKGDWTRADPAISDFLREHGRDGVPLYVLFPPKGGDGVVLPQVLTASAVLEVLDRFGS